MPSHRQKEPVIRAVTAADSEAVARIYNHYVQETIVTFEEQPVSSTAMAQRIRDSMSAKLPWLVAEQAGDLVGYALASKWKERCAYRFSREVSVYVDASYVRQGVGSRLYDRLLSQLERQGTHAVMAGIALPNEASVALHESLGFQKVAHFKEVGFKFDRWIDVGYWQRTLCP